MARESMPTWNELTWSKGGQEDGSDEKHPWKKICNLGIFLPWEMVLLFLSGIGDILLDCVKWLKVSGIPLHIVGDAG